MPQAPLPSFGIVNAPMQVRWVADELIAKSL